MLTFVKQVVGNSSSRSTGGNMRKTSMRAERMIRGKYVKLKKVTVGSM